MSYVDGYVLPVPKKNIPIYRRIALCRSLFGQHPDEMTFPGLDIDVRAYQAYISKERAKAARGTINSFVHR